jgi:hypothetical protein
LELLPKPFFKGVVCSIILIIIAETSVSNMFKLSILYTLLLIMSGGVNTGRNNEKFDKEAYFAAIAGSDLVEINSILASLEASSIPGKSAYEGALLMRKSGLLSKAREKLAIFKSGRAKLEEAIKNDNTNIEYRFLRLIIQENAPKILNYKNNTRNDAELIRTSFKKLEPVVQQAIKNYSKTSTFLKPTDL